MRDDPFFKDTPKKILDMDSQPMEFPVLYYDIRCITAIFTARMSSLRKLLPHSNLQPIAMWPGIGMLGISAFEYRDTSIGPYNEIAITVPVKFPPGFVVPGLAAISMMRRKVFPVYIHHLPVTTEIARKGGVYFFNYPKFLSDITFQDVGANLGVTLKEAGQLILKLSAKKLATRNSVHLKLHTYSMKGNVIMHSLVDGLAPLFGSVMMGNVAKLELGEHKISKELAGLDLSRIARSGFYAEGMMTKLYDPDQRWNADTFAII